MSTKLPSANLNDPDPDKDPPPSPMLYTVIYSDRLTSYATRIQAKVWSGQRDLLVNALADVAEVTEIAHRLYIYLSNAIKTRSDTQD